MKKIISLMLAMLLVLGLCACGGTTGEDAPAEETTGLQVGYGKVNITPSYKVGLGGYSDAETRESEGFIDYVYATCIAVKSGEETILIYTIDTCGLSKNDQDQIRQRVSLATEIKKEKIFIGATHGHNCPALSSYAAVDKYLLDFHNGIAQAGKDALADLSPATLHRAKADHEGMNFIRHYTLDDGTFVDNSGANGNIDRIVGHPMPTDPQMIMLKFDRAEDKKDILMVNWQAHPDDASSIGYNTISPGFIGPMRNKLEKDTGMHVAYFTGASGNQNHNSKMESEKLSYTWDEYGEKLAELAFGMIESLEPVEGTAIKSDHYILDAMVDHSWDHMLAQANEVYDVWKTQGKDAGDLLGKQYGFTSSYQARAIRSRASMGQIISMEMYTFCIGDVGFTTGTYEMFSDNSLYVKEHSPFETTFVITGCSSYVPSDVAYTYRGYEVDTGFYARGTGEQLAEKYVSMLEGLKATEPVA